MDSELLKRITVEPGKCGGKPCIRGQRMRVTDVRGLLGNGTSFDDILNDSPSLEWGGIVATLIYTGAPAS